MIYTLTCWQCEHVVPEQVPGGRKFRLESALTEAVADPGLGEGGRGSGMYIEGGVHVFVVISTHD